MDLALVVGGFLVGGGAVGLGIAVVVALRRYSAQERRIDALEDQVRAQAAIRSAAELPPDVWSIIALMRLTSKDSLDALTRISPETALAVVKEMFPQLFNRTVG